MKLNLTIALFAAALMGCASGSNGSKSDDGPATKSNGKGQVRTVSGALTNTDAETAVGARTADGRTLKGVIDPATNRFSVNLPKDVSAILSIKVGDELKKVAFVKQLTPPKADGADSWGFEIPDTQFLEDADLGMIDVQDAIADAEDAAMQGVILVGDDAGETSVWAYVDEDLDGLSDLVDLDDDGDGIEDLLDGDWKDEIDELLDLDDESVWDFFDLDDFCDLEAEDGPVCLPEDGEWFSEEECDDEDEAEEASIFCIFEGEEGWYETEDGEAWWNEAYNDALEALEDVEDAEEAVKEAEEDVNEAIDEATGAASDAEEQANQAASDAEEEAEQAASDAEQEAEQAASDAEEEAEQAASDAEEEADEAKAGAEEEADEAKAGAEEEADQAEKDAEDAASQANSDDDDVETCVEDCYDECGTDYLCIAECAEECTVD